jgi:sugar (pentulose or hexulose) kinase
VRAAVLDADGRLLGSGAAPLRSARPHPGHHEQDPQDWWAALGRATHEALARAASGGGGGGGGAGGGGGGGGGRPSGGRGRRTGGSIAIGGLAICSTSGTVLLTDAIGRVRSPVLMYDDVRARVENERVCAAERTLAAERARAAERDLAGRVARPGHPSSAVGRLIWLLGHASGGGPAGTGTATGSGGPRAGAGTGRSPATGLRLTHCAALLAGRLVGATVPTDESHALKSGYDPELRAWRSELFEALGVPAAVLPEVVAAGTPLGVVNRAASVHCGVAEGTPVLAGITDSCAAQIAAGALGPGSWSSVLGTTLALKGVALEPIVDRDAGVYSHRHPDGRTWLPGGASNVGAGALTRYFGGRDLKLLDAAAARHEPAPAVVYPLDGPGERFPFLRPDAKAIQLGELGDEAEHFAALLQGVAFVERLCLARMRALGATVGGPLRLTGGGARSDYWCQLRADISGLEVTRPVNPEPAVGMAILASAGAGAGSGDGSGAGSVTESATRMVRSDLELEPRADRAGRFEEAYRRLCEELVARGYLASVDETRLCACSGAEGVPSSPRPPLLAPSRSPTTDP